MAEIGAYEGLIGFAEHLRCGDFIVGNLSLFTAYEVRNRAVDTQLLGN